MYTSARKAVCSMLVKRQRLGFPFFVVALIMCSCVYLYIYDHRNNWGVLKVVMKENDVSENIHQTTIDGYHGDISQHSNNVKNNADSAFDKIPEHIHINLNLNLTLHDIANFHTANFSRYIKDMFNSLSEKGNSDDMNKHHINTKPESLLTLFTTWKGHPQNFKTHNFTVANWASFKPFLNPVLFTNDNNVAEHVKSCGWQVRNIPKNASNGMPILKHMYIDAIATFNSDFFGYANSDILFTDNLLNTMSSLQYLLQKNRDSKHLMITGRRWNVDNLTHDEVFPRRNLTKVAARRGALFQTSAEDYFITDKEYPWRDIPEVIVGAVAYDNWLIANARDKKQVVVDVTKTVLAVHQTDKDSVYASHFKDITHYNAELLRSIVNHTVPYHKGFTDCIEQFTDFERDSIVIRTRTLSEYCY